MTARLPLVRIAGKTTQLPSGDSVVATDATKLPLAGGSMTGPINFATAVSVVAGVAAAGILDLAPAASNFVVATGTGTVNFLNNAVATAGVTRSVRFDSVMTLVHSASRIVLPGAANVVTAAGDQAIFHYLGPSPDAWECISYQRADGTALVASAAVDNTKLPLDGSGQMTGPLKLKAQVTLTADTTVDLGAATANSVYLSGSATVTSFGTSAAAGTRYLVQFAAGIVLTASSTMVLPGSENITTQSGDIAEFEYAGSGAWRCQYYTRKDGTALVSAGSSDSTKLPLAGGKMTGALNEAAFGSYNAGTNASADITQVAANSILLNGTGNITDFGTIASGAVRRIYFQQACTLVHNSNLLLPGQANISVVNGDWAEVISMGGGAWVCSSFTRYSGAPVVSSPDSTKLPLAGGKMTGALNLATQVSIASAATVAIGAAAANTVNITGTTTITAFDTIAAGARRRLVFAGALTLTYNATSLLLPGAASIVTAAGDTAEFESLGGGNWKCTGYIRASGLSPVKALAGKASRSSSTQSIPASTITVVTFDTEVYDTANIVDISGAPNVVTVPRDGFYLVFGSACFGFNASGRRVLRVETADGTTCYARQDTVATTTGPTTVGGTSVAYLTAGTQLHMVVFQDSSAAVVLDPSLLQPCYLGIHYLGSAL